MKAYKDIMLLYLTLIIGFSYSKLFPQLPLTSLPGYEWVLYLLLAIGLYGSVYGIDLVEFKIHRKIIVNAVTFGVILKSIIIGSILWLILRSPLAFLLGVIVTQIDPLSVSYLIDKKSSLFSVSGRTILRAWSSFDDPMTVLLAFYLYLPIALNTQFTYGEYFLQLGYNLLFAAGLYGITHFIKNGKMLLLFGAFGFVIYFKLMLGIAIIGLFLRPSLPFLPQLIQITFIIASIVLGSLIKFDLYSVFLGTILGTIAFGAQGIATIIVAKKLPRIDRYFLSIAQYNGITSVILALLVEQFIPRTVTVIAVAVMVINGLYYASNHVLENSIKKEMSNKK